MVEDKRSPGRGVVEEILVLYAQQVDSWSTDTEKFYWFTFMDGV